jgi:amino acid permease
VTCDDSHEPDTTPTESAAAPELQRSLEARHMTMISLLG